MHTGRSQRQKAKANSARQQRDTWLRGCRGGRRSGRGRGRRNGRSRGRRSGCGHCRRNSRSCCRSWGQRLHARSGRSLSCGRNGCSGRGCGGGRRSHGRGRGHSGTGRRSSCGRGRSGRGCRGRGRSGHGRCPVLRPAVPRLVLRSIRDLCIRLTCCSVFGIAILLAPVATLHEVVHCMPADWTATWLGFSLKIKID